MMRSNSAATSALLAVVLFLAACGGGSSSKTEATTTTAIVTTTTAAPTTVTTPEQLAAAQLVSDKPLIVKLWRSLSDVWGNGSQYDAAFALTQQTAYPGTADSISETCLWNTNLKGFSTEYIVDQNTIQRDDGWALPAGAEGAGMVPSGRIYIMTVKITDNAIGLAPRAQDSEVHVTVTDDGHAYWFPYCTSG